MAQGLGTLWLLQRTWVHFSNPHDSAQLSITVPGNMTLYSGLCKHHGHIVYVFIYIYASKTLIHIELNKWKEKVKPFFISKSYLGSKLKLRICKLIKTINNKKRRKNKCSKYSIKFFVKKKILLFSQSDIQACTTRAQEVEIGCPRI